MSGGADGLRGVLFDMDGTLVDSEGYWMDCERALADEHGVEWADEDAFAVMGGDLLVTGARMQMRGVGMATREIAEELVTRVASRMREEIPWRPGARELLSRLREAQVPLALVTMSYRRYADEVVAGLPSGTFGAVVAGDEVTRGKPDPECFLVAAEQLGSDGAGLVIVEDSPNGVTAALASGMATLVIPFMVEVPRRPGLSRVASLKDVSVDMLRDVAGGRVVDVMNGS